MDTAGQLWLVWQLIDSAFPAGTLGHSGGLESAWHLGVLRESRDVEDFIHQSLEQQGASMLPFVRECMEGNMPIQELDALCHVFLTNPVAGRASRQQGQALVTAAERSLGLPELATAKAGWHAGRGGHLAPMFGHVMKCCAIPYATAGRMFLFMHLRGCISAAVRLNLVGPFEGQAMQRRLSLVGDQTWRRCRDACIDQIAQTSPLSDLWQVHHSRLYSRLFQS